MEVYPPDPPDPPLYRGRVSPAGLPTLPKPGLVIPEPRTTKTEILSPHLLLSTWRLEGSAGVEGGRLTAGEVHWLRLDLGWSEGLAPGGVSWLTGAGGEGHAGAGPAQRSGEVQDLRTGLASSHRLLRLDGEVDGGVREEGGRAVEGVGGGVDPVVGDG